MKSATQVKRTIQAYSVKLVKEKRVKYTGFGEHANQSGITGSADIELLLSFMSSLAEEHFYCVYLNTKLEPVGMSMISKGTTSASLVHPREVLKAAILTNAYAFVCAHNHPAGSTQPSREDIEVTELLIKAGKLMGITLLDHLIFGDSTYSFRQEKGELWY